MQHKGWYTRKENPVHIYTNEDYALCGHVPTGEIDLDLGNGDPVCRECARRARDEKLI